MDTIRQYLTEMQEIIGQTSIGSIERVISVLHEAWKQRRKVFILGNGGSASTASHMANDLAKATIVPGMQRMRALALTDCVSLITAWANDSSYADIFKEQLENLLDEGDVVIGISASGNSENVLRALEFAKGKKAVTIGLSGRSGGGVGRIADYCLRSPTDDVGMIEGAHMVIEHLIAKELLLRIRNDGGVPRNA
jgi:D-sedoheptulose 7-phosphate isomerase